MMTKKTVKAAVSRLSVPSLVPLEIQMTNFNMEFVRLARRLAAEQGYELEVKRPDPHRYEFWRMDAKEFSFAFTCL